MCWLASAAFARSESGRWPRPICLPTPTRCAPSLACQGELAATTAELQAATLAVQRRTLEIENLKFQIAKLRRVQFGRSPERLSRRIDHGPNDTEQDIDKVPSPVVLTILLASKPSTNPSSIQTIIDTRRPDFAEGGRLKSFLEHHSRGSVMPPTAF